MNGTSTWTWPDDVVVTDPPFERFEDANRRIQEHTDEQCFTLLSRLNRVNEYAAPGRDEFFAMSLAAKERELMVAMRITNFHQVFETSRQTGKQHFTNVWRRTQDQQRGGFAITETDYQLRTRAERRGHKVKPVKPGQQYLNLRRRT